MSYRTNREKLIKHVVQLIVNRIRNGRQSHLKLDDKPMDGANLQTYRDHPRCKRRLT